MMLKNCIKKCLKSNVKNIKKNNKYFSSKCEIKMYEYESASNPEINEIPIGHLTIIWGARGAVCLRFVISIKTKLKQKTAKNPRFSLVFGLDPWALKMDVFDRGRY